MFIVHCSLYIDFRPLIQRGQKFIIHLVPERSRGDEAEGTLPPFTPSPPFLQVDIYPLFPNADGAPAEFFSSFGSLFIRVELMRPGTFGCPHAPAPAPSPSFYIYFLFWFQDSVATPSQDTGAASVYIT